MDHSRPKRKLWLHTHRAGRANRGVCPHRGHVLPQLINCAYCPADLSNATADLLHDGKAISATAVVLSAASRPYAATRTEDARAAESRPQHRISEHQFLPLL